MKKVITLVLAIALVLTSVVAIAETHATPNINSFATMKTKYDEGAGIITITLSKPVDRLLIKWAEKGAEPEELAVGEDLKATALTWGHKYMPGTTQTVKAKPVAPDPTVAEVVVEKNGKWIDVGPSERVYKITTTTTADKIDEPVNYVETITKEDPWNYKAGFVFTDKDWEYLVELYKLLNPADDYEIVRPGYVTKEVEEKDKFGNVTTKQVPVTDEKGNKIYTPGYIRGINVKIEKNDKIELPKAPVVQTVIANPAQTAYMTVQGEWAVYYNREGKIVGIEYFDGQF